MAIETFILDVGEPLEFTQPAADGVMYCNGVKCFSDGQLAGPHEFVIGHRSLREAAQWWYAERVTLVTARAETEGRDVLFWEKEPYDAPSQPSPETGDVRSEGRQEHARDPAEGRQGIHRG